MSDPEASSALTSSVALKDGHGHDETCTQKPMPPVTMANQPSVALAAAAPLKKTVLKPYPFFYYRDYSTEENPDPLTPLTLPGRVPNFLAKLHAILSQAELAEIIDWLPHGRSWRVLKPREFEMNIIPKFFEHSKFSSFVRQAIGWGFRRITQGPDTNSYYHEKFLRGLPHLCKTMKRPGVAEKRTVDPDLEPDFYKISQIHPVPSSADEESIFLQKALKRGPKARMPIVTSHFQPKGHACVPPDRSEGTRSRQATNHAALVATPASPTQTDMVDEALSASLPHAHDQDEAVVYTPPKTAHVQVTHSPPHSAAVPLLRLPHVANSSTQSYGANRDAQTVAPISVPGPRHVTVTASTPPAPKAPEPASLCTTPMAQSCPQPTTGSTLSRVTNYGAPPHGAHTVAYKVAPVAAPTSPHMASPGKTPTAPTRPSSPTSTHVGASGAPPLPALGPTSATNAPTPSHAIVPVKPNTNVVTTELHPKVAFVPQFPFPTVDAKSTACSSFAAGLLLLLCTISNTSTPCSTRWWPTSITWHELLPLHKSLRM